MIDSFKMLAFGFVLINFQSPFASTFPFHAFPLSPSSTTRSLFSVHKSTVDGFSSMDTSNALKAGFHCIQLTFISYTGNDRRIVMCYFKSLHILERLWYRIKALPRNSSLKTFNIFPRPNFPLIPQVNFEHTLTIQYSSTATNETFMNLSHSQLNVFRCDLDDQHTQEQTVK